MIETFAPHRTHKSLNERILPRCVRRRDHLLNAHPQCVIAITRSTDSALQLRRS